MRTTPNPRSRGAVPAVAALVAAAALLATTVAHAAAKEFLDARLVAPISFQSPPGAQLLVAVVVSVPDGLEQHPVEGSPIWLRLTGPKGDVTEAPGLPGHAAGRYEMRITVPPGGPRRLELVIHGATDLPILLESDPFTFRPIGPGTAQLAAPLAVPTPAVRATAPAVQPPPQPASVTAPPTESPVGLAPFGVIATLVIIVIVALMLTGRARSRSRAGALPVAGPSADGPTTITGS